MHTEHLISSPGPFSFKRPAYQLTDLSCKLGTIHKRSKTLNFKELGCLQLQSHSTFRFTGDYQRCKSSLVAMSSCYPHSSSLCSHRTNELLPSVTAHTWIVLNQQWYRSSHCISCTELQLRFLTGLWMHCSVLCRINLFENSDLGSLIQRLEVEWWHELCLLNCTLHWGVLRTCTSLTIILNNSSQGLGSLLSLLLVYGKTISSFCVLS